MGRMRRKAPGGEGPEPSRPSQPAVRARPADSAAEGSRQERPGEPPSPGVPPCLAAPAVRVWSESCPGQLQAGPGSGAGAPSAARNAALPG